jgi:hypothetical protein
VSGIIAVAERVVALLLRMLLGFQGAKTVRALQPFPSMLDRTIYLQDPSVKEFSSKSPLF